MTRRRPSPEEARRRLREAANRVELGALFRGAGLKLALAAAGAGLILGASPKARRAALDGLRAAMQQVKALQGR